MSLMNALIAAGVLRAVDDAVAKSLRRLDPASDDTVLAAAALASLAVSAGHAGFDPAQPERWLDVPLPWPDPAHWAAQLRASRWVACPDTDDEVSDGTAPLVYEHGLVYLRRYREYERQVAAGLRRIGSVNAEDGTRQTVNEAVPATLKPLFAELFPDDGSDNRQAQAARLALHHRLLLVTGGPGTGKTTTITRMLVLRLAQMQEAGAAPPRIALAAPTGRAAERMAESVRHAVQALAAAGIDPQLCAQLPTTGTTLHRLLGTIPDSPHFRHNVDNPLPCDIVVVDEASMIDLPLMAKLLAAVADGAQLILLGDPDQLPSVEAGDVLTGILRAADAHSAANSANSNSTSTTDGDESGRDFPARHVHLVRGYRQSAALDLAPLATAVRAGDTASALNLLRADSLSGVHFHEGLADPLHAAARRDALLAHWASLAQADDPADALARANQLRLLTAVRDGPQGAVRLNARIEQLLAGSRRVGGTERGGHFHGQLLLVTENSYRHRLFNGDTGICLRDGQGRLTAWFPGDGPGQPRAFHPAALPAHDSAFAMTVHKAQGSEFDRVWLLLPVRDNRVLSRELVYTGMTRARSELHIAASAAVLADALSRHAGRWSGLEQRLRSR